MYIMPYRIVVAPPHQLGLKELCGYIEPAVSFWAPRREEIQRVVEVSKLVSSRKKPVIVDIGCGSGLVDYLLATTGEVEVIGIDPAEHLISKAKEVYRHPHLRFEGGDAESLRNYTDKVDVAFNSWMPMDINLSPYMLDLNALAIIYVRDKAGATGVARTLFYEDVTRCDKVSPLPDDALSYHSGENYRTAMIWDGPAFMEIRGAIRVRQRWIRRLLALRRGDTIQNRNEVIVQLRTDVEIQNLEISTDKNEKYPWEGKLEEILGPLSDIRLVESTR
jgi:SAM-dependent methyltransferase